MILAALLLGCAPPVTCADPGWTPRTLAGAPNPFTEDEPLWSPQPHRDRPLEVVADGRTAFVSLQGTEDEPGSAVVRVDLTVPEVLGRVELTGASPTGLALDPSGRLLVVLQRFSNFFSVVDAETGRLLHDVATDFYATEAAFTPDGRELWITNRWRDAVRVLDVDVEDRGLGIADCAGTEIPVGTNPRDLAIATDGGTVAVASLTGLDLTIVDRDSRAARARVRLGAPAAGVAFAGDWIVVPTLSASTHHPASAGPDGDGDGRPGDGTPNVNFQDLQNEIAVVEAATGAIVHRYTSDSICCRDFRDTDPADLAREGDLLPPEADWIVGGAVPEQVAVAERDDGTWAWVTYSGSDEWQRFRVDPDTGALDPTPAWATTGHAPHGITLVGDTALVVHHLGETLGLYDGSTGTPLDTLVVGDVEAGAFPATDAEIGELFNVVTAPFTVDGDQACAACHREGGNLDKALSMPLLLRPGMGSRLVQAYRGAADTRPWFIEGAMDETNFRPVINEFARIENFCCSDYTLFPDGAPADCATNPPPECASASNPGSEDGFGVARGRGFEHPRPTASVSRDTFFLSAAARVVGRVTTFGDALVVEDVVSGVTTPMPLDFDGITRALGVFLLARPRLLPNPNDPGTAAAERGRALFERADVGCATCHPTPAGTISTASNPFSLPLRLAPVVSPMRDADGVNLDLLADGFMQTFPYVEQDACSDVCRADVCAADPAACDDLRNARFGPPALRGLWDRAAHLLHDGRANGLREVLCTPGHPALHAGETGYNERDGVPDTHGGTSQLTPRDIDDLIAYLLTL